MNEIIFSTSRTAIVSELPDDKDNSQLEATITCIGDRVYSITFPLPVIKLVLNFNGNAIIDLTQSEQSVKIITFQVPVNVFARGVQISVKYQLDPLVFQDQRVKFDSTIIKICSPHVKYGTLTNADEQKISEGKSLDEVLDQLKTYKLD